jgi:hypothetical protein
MIVTNVSGTTWTVSRAQDGTGATPGSVGFAHSTGVPVDQDVIASYITNINTQATTHVHTGSDQSASIFDSTAPVTQGFGDTASGGSVLVAAHRDHIHGMPSPAPYYNTLPNGDFVVWQRGTTFTSPANGALAADMWHWQDNVAGVGRVTITRDTSVPAVATNAINTPYSLKIAVTTADTSIAAGELYGPYAIIEGYDYRALTNGFTTSFWVKAHRTGTYCVAFSNKGDRTYVGEYTINSADTWEYKTIVVPTPPTAGTWGYTNDQGLLVSFTMAVGTTYQTTAGAWQTNLFYGTSNQVNGVAATTDTLSLALVNIVPGSVAVPLYPRPYTEQLARCQRYYCYHGFSTGVNQQALLYTAAGSNVGETRQFPVTMGGTPTVTKVGTWTLDNVSAQPTVTNACPDSYLIYAPATVTARAGFYCTTTAEGVTAEWNP